MRTLRLASLLVVVASSATAVAQEATVVQKTTLTGSGELAVPVGDFGDAVGFGFGAQVGLAHALQERLSLTGSIGFIYHLEKDDVNVQFIQVPILGGARWYVDAAHRLYLSGELGLNWLRAEAQVDSPFGGGSASDSETHVALQAGVGIELGTVDVRGTVLFPAIDEDSDLALVATAGVRFASF